MFTLGASFYYYLICCKTKGETEVFPVLLFNKTLQLAWIPARSSTAVENESNFNRVAKINESGRIKEEGSKECTLFSGAIQGGCLFKFSGNLHPLAARIHFSFTVSPRRVEGTLI